MFWLIYSVIVLLFSCLVSMYSREHRLIIFCLSLVILLTPAQIEVGSSGYAPALFSFLFDVILEQDYSLRALRPLVLSIPLSFFILFLLISIKKRFF